MSPRPLPLDHATISKGADNRRLAQKTRAPSHNTSRGWSLALIGIVVFTACYRYALPTRDGDIWFHLLYGQYFLDHWTLIPDHTIFSWSPSSNEYLYCTWLSDIFFYLLYQIGGLGALFTFRYLCIFTLIGACLAYSRQQGVARHPLTWLVCLLGVFMSYTAIVEKPEIFSFLFMILFCWNWWYIRLRREQAWRYCYLFPLLMLVWVNSHGGFVFGCIFLLVAWCGEQLNTWLAPQHALSPKLRRHLLLSLVLAVVSLFCTPYGYHYPLQFIQEFLLAKSSITLNSTIASYQSPFAVVDYYGFALCANIAVLTLLLLLMGSFRRIEWSLLLLNLTFVTFYTLFFRTTFFWVPVFLFSSLTLLPGLSNSLQRFRMTRAFDKALPMLVTLIMLGLSCNYLFASLANPELHLWMGFGISRISAEQEVEYIQNNFPDAKIGNTYDPGSYLLWRLWPRNKVFLDARYFPYHNWVREALAFEGGQNIPSFVARQSCEVWLISISARPALMWFYSSPQWQLAFYGNSAAVFVRRDIPLPDATKKSSTALLDLKNFANAGTLLTWVINIEDWENAEEILDAMGRIFWLPQQQESILDSRRFTKASKAYSEHHYDEAVFWFAQTKGMAINNDRQFAHALIQLSVAAWYQGEGRLARQYNQRAWALTPGYYMNIYNAALMNWSDWQAQQGQEVLKDSVPPIKRGLWEMQLREFLRSAPPGKALLSYRHTAGQILAQQYQGPLVLMTP